METILPKLGGIKKIKNWGTVSPAPPPPPVSYAHALNPLQRAIWGHHKPHSHHVTHFGTRHNTNNRFGIYLHKYTENDYNQVMEA